MFIIIRAYVDYIVLILQSQDSLDQLKSKFIEKVNIKDLSKVKTILRWEITQDPWEKILKIDQKRYIKDFLEFEGRSLYHPIVFWMKRGLSLILDQNRDYFPIEIIVYQRLIRKLIYLACETKSDIVFILE